MLAALILCLWPADVPPPPAVLGAVRQVASAADLFDPWDGINHFLNPECWEDDLEWLRDRMAEVRGLPRLDCLDRFPGHVASMKAQQQNAEHDYWIADMMGMVSPHNRDDLQAWEDYRRSSKRLGEMWSWLQAAQEPNLATVYRRQCLRDLRDELRRWDYSWACWDEGRMPPSMPVWVFKVR